MVINIGAIKTAGSTRGWRYRVRCESGASKGAGQGHLGNGRPDLRKKVLGCELAVKAGADFVKTSSGFGTGGATEEDVALMKSTVGDRAIIKASTGINCRVDAGRMIRAGAVRLGSSKGIRIVTGG